MVMLVAVNGRRDGAVLIRSVFPLDLLGGQVLCFFLLFFFLSSPLGAALFVFDCGKIPPLSVRVPRSLDRRVPWGPPPGPGLLRAPPPLSQQPPRGNESFYFFFTFLPHKTRS